MLQKHFKDETLRNFVYEDGRKFLLEGTFLLEKKIERSGKEDLFIKETLVRKEYTFLLFNDVLVQLKLNGSVYKTKATIKMSSKKHPASIFTACRRTKNTINENVDEELVDKYETKKIDFLRIVDNDSILYLQGNGESLRKWKIAINNRNNLI
jgi:hypothetical protein